MTRVACIEEDANLREVLNLVLRDAGFETDQWPVPAGAQAFLRRVRPDVLILEVRFGGEYAGLPILEGIRADPATAAMAVIVCSGDIQFLRAHDRAVRALNCTVLEKPFTACQLLGAIRRAIEPARFRQRNRTVGKGTCAAH